MTAPTLRTDASALLQRGGEFYAAEPVACACCGETGRWWLDMAALGEGPTGSAWCPRLTCGGLPGFDDSRGEALRLSDPFAAGDGQTLYAPDRVLCICEELDADGEVVDRYVSVAPRAALR